MKINAGPPGKLEILIYVSKYQEEAKNVLPLIQVVKVRGCWDSLFLRRFLYRIIFQVLENDNSQHFLEDDYVLVS